jgi:phenylacetate-CoA ligase
MRRRLGALYPPALDLLTLGVIEPAMGVRHRTVSGWLRTFWAWPEDRRRDWQRERLSAVLTHAQRAVPAYREWLGGAGAPGRLGLANLPVVDKTAFRARPLAFRSEGWEQLPHIAKHTGGSTGDPFAYPLDPRAWGQIAGANLHAWESLGYRYGERVVMLGAPTSLGLERPRLSARLRHALERHDVSLAGYALDPEVSLARARAASARQAALWYGYASTIAAMADAVLAAGRPLPGPGSIVTTAEVLEPAWRERIEAAFASRVVDQYGCNDGGVLAHTCARGRYHLADNVSLVEILEGDEACPAGVEGDVVVTNLHARVMPFLRYRVGDRAVRADDVCPCGAPGSTLARIVGRKTDVLTLPDGSRISGQSFGQVFARVRGVRRWQIVQSSPARVRVRVEADPDFDGREAERVLSFVRGQCGEKVEVTLTADEPLSRSPGGKHRVVVGA